MKDACAAGVKPDQTEAVLSQLLVQIAQLEDLVEAFNG
jgi:hypothetical protein